MKAYLNSEDICILCSNSPHFWGGIPVDHNVLYMKYVDGEWIDVGYVPQEELPEPTETELIQAELLLNQMDIMAKQAEHDEVLAEILLNQLGV